MTRLGDVNYRDVPGRGDMPGRGGPEWAEDGPEDEGPCDACKFGQHCENDSPHWCGCPCGCSAAHGASPTSGVHPFGTRVVSLIVLLTVDDRFESECIADHMLAVLSAESNGEYWDVVETVAVEGYTTFGRPAACPHCGATDKVPLSSGLSCTNAWHRRRR